VVSARRPAALKLVEGDPGHEGRDALEGRGLRVSPAAPPEPDWATWFPPRGTGAERRRLVAENRRAREEASALWRSVVPTLDAHGLLSGLDEGVLATLCLATARRNQLERRISTEGPERDGQRGRVRHPLAPMVKGYADEIRWCSLQLGLTPVARDGFAAAPPPANGEVVWDG
jgi:P27 family predicted phage terminase small subunit